MNEEYNIRLGDVMLSESEYARLMEHLDSMRRSLQGEQSRLMRLLRKRTPAHGKNVSAFVVVQAQLRSIRDLLSRLGKVEEQRDSGVKASCPGEGVAA